MNKQKLYIAVVVLVLSAFGLKAMAALTLNSTTLTSDGALTLTGATTIGVVSGATSVATFGIPSGSSLASNFLNVTGTFPAVPSVGINGAYFSFTGAGATSVNQTALRAELLAGYTGSGSTFGAAISNATAGTGLTTGSWVGAVGGNNGIFVSATGVATGVNKAIYANANSSSRANIGVMGNALSSTSSPINNVGGAFSALNATNNVAGYFALLSTHEPTLTSSVILADNGATGSPIFTGRNNGSQTFRVAADGTVSIGATPVTISTGAGDPEGVVTAVVGSLYLRNDGSTNTTLYVKTSGVGNTGWTAK